jgi:cytochrome c553
MKQLEFIATVVVASGLAACTNLERSRNLNDPGVPVSATAQQVCSNCHGVDGNSTSPNFPNLAAQPQTYIVHQLEGFREHSRSDPAGFEYMWGLSRHLTDGQIEGLAAYFSGQKPRGNAVRPDAAQASAGKKIFEGGVPEKSIPACVSCHGDRGQGKDQFPRLAGQHADYVMKQLSVFQRTDERPKGAVMKVIAHDLTGENMRDVAAFLQGMPPE